MIIPFIYTVYSITLFDQFVFKGPPFVQNQVHHKGVCLRADPV